MSQNYEIPDSCKKALRGKNNGNSVSYFPSIDHPLPQALLDDLSILGRDY